MSMTLDRKTLQQIRATAKYLAIPDCVCPEWTRAFDELADAANRLDAMLARERLYAFEKDEEPDKKPPYFKENICPACGLNSLRHDFTEEELKERASS
jgi:hypothetical protein